MRRELFATILFAGFAAGCNNDENPVTFDPGNAPPVIQAITFVPDTIIAGQSCIVKCIATDSNDDVLTYEWKTIGNIAGKGASVYYTPNSCCSEPKIELTVRDSKGKKVDSLFVVPFKYDE